MQRNISIDLLKLLLSFFVVGLHLHFFEEINKSIGYFLYQGIFRIAVPLFLVINGYYFARIEDFAAYKKWLLRILFLYFFWMIVYAPVWFSSNMNFNILTVLKGYFHLWYIIGIAYCSVFIFYLRNQNIKIIIFLSLLFYSIGVFLQYAHAYQYIDIPNYTYRNFIFFCFPLFSAGFLVTKLELNHQLRRNINPYLIAATILFLSEIIFNLYQSNHKVSFDIYGSFIVLCPLLFYKISQLKINLNLKNLALIASVIYFIHPLVYISIQHYWHLESIHLTCLTLFLSSLLSYPLIMLNKKIRIL